jgi:hypothetical protein
MNRVPCMPSSAFSFRTLAPVLACLAILGCGDRQLRGTAEPSDDGKTYLAVADDGNGACRPIYVDGELWPHAVDVAVEVAPGSHTISCGGDISFEIPAGTVFRFDYWGP